MSFRVIKVGGSLMGCAREMIRRLSSVPGNSYLIIPGGGPMADLVRDLFQRHQLSQEAAHWMAVLAMEQYAYFLADGTGAALTIEISKPLDGVVVLLPYQALFEDDLGLAHSWDYTSDSVAALVASRLKTDFVKATNVEGIVIGGAVTREVQAADLKGYRSCIDQGALRILISSKRSCMILNGSDPERFVSSLLAEDWGTVVRG